MIEYDPLLGRILAAIIYMAAALLLAGISIRIKKHRLIGACAPLAYMGSVYMWLAFAGQQGKAATVLLWFQLGQITLALSILLTIWLVYQGSKR